MVAIWIWNLELISPRNGSSRSLVKLLRMNLTLKNLAMFQLSVDDIIVIYLRVSVGSTITSYPQGDSPG